MKHIYLIFFCLLGSFYVGAQCPAGQTEITIEVVTAGFPAEVGWELVDQTTGTVIACQPAGTVAGTVVEGPFCVTDGNTIVFTGYDSFGDDWNGGFANITITEDGSINGCAAQDGCVVIQNGGENVDAEPDVSVTNSCETSNEEFILTLTTTCDATPISGCTDPTAPNFNTCATTDDGSCTPPQDECVGAVPYPGDVLAGTCVTNFDFTVFTDSGNPSPTCDFGGDAVAWFSWTAPIITAAGDPIDLTFDDGDGQAMDCDIGIEAYEVDCTTPASNCLGNVSGALTGLTQGTDYILLIYDDGPPEANCDFCLSVACSAPIVTATAICQPGDESGFYVEVDVTNIGVGNAAYTVDVGGPQADITAVGMTTYGPFPSGTPIDVVLTGVDDATCGFTVTGLDRTCTCPPDLALSGPVGPYCTDDAAVAITYAPTGPFESSVSIEFLTTGAFDTEILLGLYPGTFDDGSVIGLPPVGTGLLGTGDETDIENSAPGANDLNAVEAYNPAPVGAPIVLSNLPAGDYTIYLGDDFGDGWNGATLLVTDECGNVLATEASIEAISGDVQDELAWVNFTLPLQAPVITVAGNGVVQTADPDGIANNGDETYEFDPSQITATGCDPVTETLTLTTDVCGVICETTIDVQVFPPAQAPTITLDDAVCNYTITEACTGDVLDVTSTTAAPGDDPAPIDVTVTTANGCTATFPVDPPACPTNVIMGCTDPCAPNYDMTATMDDGTCDPYDMTCNADCTAGPFGGTWDPTTCACINETAPVSGCMDATACNFDPAANCDDGSCLPAPVCNTDPCAGDIQIVDPADACSCITDEPQVLGCTDAMADNFDPTANCDDGSCMTTSPLSIGITDPCNCTQGVDLDGDGINDLAQETITITPGVAPYSVAGFTGTLYDNAGNVLTTADLNSAIMGTTLVFYVDADGSSVYSVTIGDGAGQSATVDGGPCTICQDVANIPTVGEWGLIILGLLMSITAVVGIRQRREEEVYG